MDKFTDLQDGELTMGRRSSSSQIDTFYDVEPRQAQK